MRTIMGMILATSLLAAPLLGAGNKDVAEKARRDAVTHYRSMGWLAGGCLSGFFSALGGSIVMGVAAASNPNPPIDALSGVPEGDRRYYTACYKNAVWDMQMRDATLGIVAGMALYTGIVAVAALTQ